MDALGLILAVVVTAASVQDDEGARLIFGSIRGRFGRLGLVWADGIYERVADWVAAHRPACPARPEVVERSGPGFKALKRRWIVERTFAWPRRNRRLSKDHEVTISCGEAFVKPAMMHLTARRIVKKLDLELSQHALRSAVVAVDQCWAPARHRATTGSRRGV